MTLSFLFLICIQQRFDKINVHFNKEMLHINESSPVMGKYIDRKAMDLIEARYQPNQQKDNIEVTSVHLSCCPLINLICVTNTKKEQFGRQKLFYVLYSTEEIKVYTVYHFPFYGFISQIHLPCVLGLTVNVTCWDVYLLLEVIHSANRWRKCDQHTQQLPHAAE